MKTVTGPGSVPRLAVIGDTAIDYFLTLPRRRPGDEKVTATSSLRLPGGTGANAAAAAAVLGSQVTFYSMVGTDRLGDWVVRSLTSRGVVTSGVLTVAGSTTQATILLDEGGRQVIVDRGVADRLGELDPDQIHPADIVYVTGSSAAITRLAEAETRGYLVAGIEAAMTDDARLDGVLERLDLIITNSAGWTALAETAAGIVTAIETRGAEGAVIHAPECSDGRISGIQVDAVDATGAGDCFAGALCHYLANGLDLAAACQLAVMAAGLSTLAVGAQNAFPTDAEVRAAAVGVHPSQHVPEN